jgi:hypothetical protein
MSWKCRHCGFESERETSCCYAHWEEAANARTSSFWFVGSAAMTALGFVVLLFWFFSSATS